MRKLACVVALIVWAAIEANDDLLLNTDASMGVKLKRSGSRSVRVQADVFNLANRLNVVNFAGLLSGTAIGAPRSGSVRLRCEF